MIELTTDGLVYEVLQRHLRNAVVDHVRDSFRVAYGDKAVDQLRRPFKEEEWDEAARSAESARVLGFVTREHIDEFDYLGINHLFNIFDAHFDVLIPSEELPPKEFMGKMRQETLGWLRDIRGVRDPISHPPAEDLPVSDAVRVVDSAWRLLRRLHLVDEAETVSQIYGELVRRTAEAAPPDPLQEGLYDTLPPAESIVVDFVGREEELKALWSWLLSGASNRWMLAGDGGKGKSAIAYRFASLVRAFKPEPLCAVFWMTAKRRRFEEGQTINAGPADFWDLDSALDKILTDYGWPEETTQSVDAKRTTVTSLLDEFPALLVVDDLDSIPPDEEDVVEFLTLEAPRARSRILATSRRLFAGMGKTCTTVAGLGESDAMTFIESRAQLLEIPPPVINESQRRQVVAICEGSPLYMEDFLRLCKFLPFIDAIEAWRSRQGDEVRQYALDREIEMLTPTAKEVLHTCALAEQPLSLLEIQRITGRAGDASLAAVDELTRMYLVRAPELIEDIPRFQVNRNLALLVRESLEESQAARVGAAIWAVLGKLPGPAVAKSVGDYCRQARVLVEGQRYKEAAQTIEAGLGSMRVIQGCWACLVGSTGEPVHPAERMQELLGSAPTNSAPRIESCISTGLPWRLRRRDGRPRRRPQSMDLNDLERMTRAYFRRPATREVDSAKHLSRASIVTGGFRNSKRRTRISADPSSEPCVKGLPNSTSLDLFVPGS